MRVKVYATLRDLVGASSVEVSAQPGEPVKVILERLVAQSPALREKLWQPDGTLTGWVTVFLNGRDIRYLQGLDTPFSPGDELDLFPPVGGG